MELLNGIETRIIGSLIEKEITTPEYYPLSLNSLTNACNQKSSRDPVVSYSEDEVESAINSLREKKLVIMVHGEGRVAKFREAFVEALQLSPKETAVVTLLMLRGPQTTGELRSRSGRLYEFKSLEEVENTLLDLSNRETSPLVMKLEKQTGLKERRYAHLLSGVPVLAERNTLTENHEDKLNVLTAEVERLKEEIEILKEQFAQFKKQFE